MGCAEGTVWGASLAPLNEVDGATMGLDSLNCLCGLGVQVGSRGDEKN